MFDAYYSVASNSTCAQTSLKGCNSTSGEYVPSEGCKRHHRAANATAAIQTLSKG